MRSMPKRRGPVLRREATAAVTKCATQRNSDAIERLGLAKRTHAPRMKSEGVKGRTCGGSDLGMRSGGRQPATEKSWIQILINTRRAQIAWFVRAFS